MRGWLVGLLACVGCGRIAFEPRSDAGSLALCGETTSVGGPIADPDVVLSATPRPGDAGLHVLWNRRGGVLEGINLSALGAPDPQTPAPIEVIELSYRSHAATRIGADLLVAPTLAADPPMTFIKIVPDDLSGYDEQALVAGLATRDTYVERGGARGMVLVVDNGMTEVALDATWTPAGSAVVATAPGGIAGAVAALDGDATVAVWTLAAACTGWIRPGEGRLSYPAPCARPRLARGMTSTSLVYERAGEIVVVDDVTAIETEGGGVAVAAGASPRIAFDGTRRWLAFLDGASLRAGYLEGGALHAIAAGPAAGTDAFELAVSDGKPRLVAVRGDGISVTTLCAD